MSQLCKKISLKLSSHLPVYPAVLYIIWPKRIILFPVIYDRAGRRVGARWRQQLRAGWAGTDALLTVVCVHHSAHAHASHSMQRHRATNARPRAYVSIREKRVSVDLFVYTQTVSNRVPTHL